MSGTERFPSSNIRRTVEGSSNPSENYMPQPSNGRGRGNRGRGYAGGRRGGKWTTDPLGAENIGSPPGFEAKVRRNVQKKWENKEDGLTDLGKKMYSIKWLLERSGKDAVKDCIFDLPDSLNKKFLSPSSQKRNYPFTTILQSPLNGNEREVGQDNSEDVSITGSQKQVKKEKDYTISPQNQQRTFQFQEDTRSRNNVFPRSNKEFGQTPARHDNLFAPTATKQSSAGLMAAVAEAMNVQSRPALQQLEPKIKALLKGEYLHNRMGPNKSLPTSPSDRLQHPETSTPGVVRQRNKVPHDYDFKHENAKKASRACSGLPHEMNLKSLADTYPENPQLSREQPNSKPRRGTSSLKESERAILATMLTEKIRKYSVQPSKLSYASRTRGHCQMAGQQTGAQGH